MTERVLKPELLSHDIWSDDLVGYAYKVTPAGVLIAKAALSVEDFLRQLDEGWFRAIDNARLTYDEAYYWRVRSVDPDYGEYEGLRGQDCITRVRLDNAGETFYETIIEALYSSYPQLRPAPRVPTADEVAKVERFGALLKGFYAQ